MKKFATLLLCLSTFYSYSQKRLTQSRTGSYYTYIYKISDADLLKLYQNPDEGPDDKILHNPVDSCKTEKVYSDNNLPAGNYLKVYAEENQLQYALIEKHTVYIHLLDNSKNTNFILTDNAGNIIRGALVRYNNKTVDFNPLNGAYSINKLSKNDVIQANYNGVTNFYKLDNSNASPVFLSGEWFKRQWSQIKNVFRKNNRNYYRRSNQQDFNYSGFMVFNKPKYKPHDTVRFKAFIINSKIKKPLDKPTLLVKVSRRYNNEDDKLIGTVTSYRTGAYEYSFVLTDSLTDSVGIDLDESYKINLEDPKKLKPHDKGDDGDNPKHLIYASGQFQYEEYELKSIKFTMRADNEESSPGNPMNIYFKAVDENGLPVPDGRVNVFIRESNVSVYQGKHYFIPDTLWQHIVQLDPLGETKFTLPDSIFPKTSISYTIMADFYNSANEHQSNSKYVNYNYARQTIKSKLVNDSLQLTGFINGWAAALNADIYGTSPTGDTIYKKRAVLPFLVKVNPVIKLYDIKTDSATNTFMPGGEDGGISISGYRKADSVSLKVDNSRHLHFWYAIYLGKKLIDKGEADSLSYKKLINSKENILCKLSYLWGGEVRSASKILPLTDKLLTITVKQPYTVYPGQKATTEIDVKDNKGNPAVGADITAWALTSKFEDYQAPFVPYLGKRYPVLGFPRQPRISDSKNTWITQLNWNRWGREMGLDSIEYYKFTHADTIYRTEEALSPGDTATQIAPFVVYKGGIIPVHVIYIDERPVYFSQAEQLKRYSFRVDSGKHNITLRTVDLDIRLDNIYVEKGKKLILAVNDTLTNRSAHIIKMPDTLNQYESGLLNKYMIKIANTFDSKLATLTQDNKLFVLNPELNSGYNRYNYRFNNNNFNEILAGPLADNYANYSIKGEAPRTFLTEPGYVYTFLPGLLKQKSILTPYPFSTKLWIGDAADDYKQYALSQISVDTLWQNYLDLRSQTTRLFPNEPIASRVTGSLNIALSADDFYKYFIKNVIVYKYDDPDYIQVYPGNTTSLGQLEQGKYRLFFLLKKDDYAIVENIVVKPYGENYYEIKLDRRPKDSLSIKIGQVIANRSGIYNKADADINNDALLLKETFNEKYLDKSNFKSVIYGTVNDGKDPVVGASVHVKGTSTGATTDISGRFRLNVPPTGKIIIQFIGYVTQELNIEPGKNYNIRLLPSSQALNEVVVIGYGVQRKAAMMGSVTTISRELEGRLPGFFSPQSSGQPGKDASVFFIRGLSSIDQTKQPLIIVDGVPVSYDNLQKLNPNDISEISILKSAAATAIYGAQAVNGVLIVITKKQGLANAANGAATGEGSIRKNFSDYAYWQPKLTTDAEGKASFSTVFPDDITSWRTFVIGINDEKETGYSESLIKSFKPLSASFISPAFAVVGDKLSAIGKVMNYNAEPAKLSRSFTYNGKLLKQDDLTITNSKIDTLNVTAGNTDSLSFEYSIKKESGYFDGEQRKIPVIQQGVQETKGIFDVLNGDTSVNLNFDGTLGKITLHAESSVLPALIEETDHLRDYKYLCNEQLASKLKGLLVEKRIKAYLHEPFKHEKNITDVIKKLDENRGTQGIWGWWKDTNDELWISLHAIEALLEAEKDGYKIDIDKQKITDYLVYQLESYKGRDKITCLEMLHTMNAKVDYKKYIADADKANLVEKHPSQYDHFRILLLKQQAGISINIDDLLKTQHNTLFGNVYWGDDNYQFFDNSVQLSVLAYSLFKNDGKHPEVLQKIRGYLLEERHDGYWRNTYESSLILETILPEVLVSGEQVKAPLLKLSGAKDETVDKFPYTTTFTGTSLGITKSGTLPVYLTGYQQFWNSQPIKVSKDFTVDTWFEKNGNTITKLKGGERVQLRARVTAKGDGDFVMIDIPIPAGCSYEGKDQAWANNEVHREYFKEKVSIFCRLLKQGTYTFTIDLMPRFDGEYTLNPAKAELMYFPVFYGRESMKTVDIGSK